MHKRDKVFKNGPSKICERQPLKNLKGYLIYKIWSILEYLDSNTRKFYMLSDVIINK